MSKPYFGDLLRELRNEKKLSLRAVADKTGLSYSYIAQLEKVRHGSGKPVTPSVDALIKLAKAYDMKRNEMIDLYLSVGDSGLLQEVNADINELDELTAGMSKIPPRKFDIGEHLLDGLKAISDDSNSSVDFLYKGTVIKKNKQNFKVVLEETLGKLDKLSKTE